MKNHNIRCYKWNKLNCESPSRIDSKGQSAAALKTCAKNENESSCNPSQAREAASLCSCRFFWHRHYFWCCFCLQDIVKIAKQVLTLILPTNGNRPIRNKKTASLCSCHFLWHCWYAGSCWCLQDNFQCKSGLSAEQKRMSGTAKSLDLGTLNVRPSLETLWSCHQLETLYLESFLVKVIIVKGIIIAGWLCVLILNKSSAALETGDESRLWLGDMSGWTGAHESLGQLVVRISLELVSCRFESLQDQFT